MRESGDKAKKTKNFIIGGRVVIQNSKFLVCVIARRALVRRGNLNIVKQALRLRHCEENFSSMWQSLFLQALACIFGGVAH